ncbi:MAG: SMI1/KNR4 family protein [Acidobacteriota bacterium]
MEFKYLSDVVEFYEKFVQPYKGKPIGCSNSEINYLENYFGFQFPLAYKEYLKFMGKDNCIFIGSECFFGNVIENTKYLPELLSENNIDFVLPDKYLVFFVHQGYMAAWFELPKKSENPEVWFFTESSNNEMPKIIGTFTETILSDMKGMAKYLPEN